MRVLLLPGIWPPDIGGPATHGPDLARFLTERGHALHVVTMGDGPPAERPCPVESVSRSLPFPARYGLVAAKGARAARSADVVYASATYAAAAAAATAARRPLVAKLVSDPAYERARRYGLFSGTLEEFQRAEGVAPAALRAARSRVLAAAEAVVVPSEYLAAMARSWVDERRIVVIRNPAPEVTPAAGAPEAGVFVFAGRLTRQKALAVAIEAVGRVPTARLVVLGDGPDRDELERRAAALDGRVVFRGSLPRDEVLRRLSTATAAVISSDWENLPHAAVEALAVGVPVVATAVGGVPEVVRSGENGLLVAPGRPDELAAALARLLDEDGLRDRLAAGARASVAGLSREAAYGRLEQILLEASRG